MDCWIVALRGNEDALIEARAVFGPPLIECGPLQVFTFETVDPNTAAEWITRAATTIHGLAGAVILERSKDTEARERALALACAAAPGEILFDRPTKDRLDHYLLFVRPAPRSGWSLPLTAVALAPIAPLRAPCREAVARLNASPRLVAREREIAALLAATASSKPVVLRAPAGAGGGRIIAEAAARSGKRKLLLPPAVLRAGPEAFQATLDRWPDVDWIVIDPLSADAVHALGILTERLPLSRRLVIRADPSVPIPFVPPTRQITVPPLREYDARALIRRMLGDATDERIVVKLARRAGGMPRRLVETVRAAVQLGEIIPQGDAWIHRTRRVLRSPGTLRDPIQARLRDLPPRQLRALTAVAVLEDGALVIEALATLRGALSSDPEPLFHSLVALGMIEVDGDFFSLPATLRALLPAPEENLVALVHSGALEPAAQGEALRRQRRFRDAAEPFAHAATMALHAGLHAAAVRYAAASNAEPTVTARLDPVRIALRAVATALGPTVVCNPIGPEAARTERDKSIDPVSIAPAEEPHELHRDKTAGTHSLTSAKLVRARRDNAQRTPQRPKDPAHDGASKSHLMTALSQATAGDVPQAVRTALSALAIARRAGDVGGEAAALALLSALYRAVGREHDAVSLARKARALHSRAR